MQYHSDAIQTSSRTPYFRETKKTHSLLIRKAKMRIDYEIVGEAELTKRYLAGATATKMPKAGEPNDATASELYQSIQISEKELNDLHSKLYEKSLY